MTFVRTLLASVLLLAALSSAASSQVLLVLLFGDKLSNVITAGYQQT